ncbi:MAG: lysophospholipid acyltransferase family protein [Bacteroidota bacterium]
MTKSTHLLEYVLLRITGTVVRLLPFAYAGKLGAALGSLIYSFGYRRSVTERNLRNAFPEYSDSQIRAIARGAFRTVGASLVEILWTPRLTKERVRAIVHYKNPEVLKSLYDRGKGVVLLSAHFGNWELMGHSIPAHLDVPMLEIVKLQSNPLVDREIDSFRQQLGNNTVPMEHSVREVLKALGEGRIVGMLADQTAPKDSVQVEFFGRQTPTFEGPAAFSLKTGAPIALGFTLREPDGSFSQEFYEVEAPEIRGDSRENIALLTQKHVRLTEEFIRKHPEQWMWMHKRWKHVPDRSVDSSGAE